MASGVWVQQTAAASGSDRRSMYDGGGAAEKADGELGICPGPFPDPRFLPATSQFPFSRGVVASLHGCAGSRVDADAHALVHHGWIRKGTEAKSNTEACRKDRPATVARPCFPSPNCRSPTQRPMVNGPCQLPAEQCPGAGHHSLRNTARMAFSHSSTSRNSRWRTPCMAASTLLPAPRYSSICGRIRFSRA